MDATTAVTSAAAGRSTRRRSGKYLTFPSAARNTACPSSRCAKSSRCWTSPGAAGAGAREGRHQPARQGHPVIDLRAKFSLPAQDYTERTCIVVVDVSTSRRVMLGVIVDAVSEVLNIAAAEIDQTPDFGAQVVTDYMLGLAKVKNTVKILLDLDCVLGAEGALGSRVPMTDRRTTGRRAGDRSPPIPRWRRCSSPRRSITSARSRASSCSSKARRATSSSSTTSSGRSTPSRATPARSASPRCRSSRTASRTCSTWRASGKHRDGRRRVRRRPAAPSTC